MRIQERVIGWQASPNGFVEILPNEYAKDKKYPLLIWIPGQGELGSGSDASLDKLNQTIVTWLKSNNVDFIVIVVQYPWNGWKVTNFVKWVLNYYSVYIDRNSLHMAGLSMGGYVIRDFIIEGSDTYKLFSTFTTMSTNLNDAVPFAKRIVDNDQYIWAHHGETDGGANQPATQANFIAAVQKIDFLHALMSLYRGLGHSAWNQVYNGNGRATEEVASGTLAGATLFKWLTGDFTWWEWMLSHDKRKQVEPPVEPPVDPPVVVKTVGDGEYDALKKTLTWKLSTGETVSTQVFLFNT